MKFLNFENVLCLSPHPDDVELGMMGTILKNQNTYFDILCLSRGGDFDETTSKSRIQEVKDVWENDTNNVNLFFTENKHVKDLSHDAWVNYIETNFTNKNKYDCLIIPTKEDAHFEHKIINELASPLTRVKNISIIEYKTPSTTNLWTPDIFTDITSFEEKKYNKLRKFESQLHRWYFEKDLIRTFHLNYQSYKKGIKYVEQFKLIQLYH